MTSEEILEYTLKSMREQGHTFPDELNTFYRNNPYDPEANADNPDRLEEVGDMRSEIRKLHDRIDGLKDKGLITTKRQIPMLSTGELLDRANAPSDVQMPVGDRLADEFRNLELQEQYDKRNQELKKTLATSNLLVNDENQTKRKGVPSTKEEFLRKHSMNQKVDEIQAKAPEPLVKDKILNKIGVRGSARQKKKIPEGKQPMGALKPGFLNKDKPESKPKISIMKAPRHQSKPAI